MEIQSVTRKLVVKASPLQTTSYLSKQKHQDTDMTKYLMSVDVPHPLMI